MMLTRLLPSLLLFGGLFFAGCQTRSSIGEISVTVVDIKPIGATLLESRALMTLRYINENVVPVAISGSNHKLYLNGTYVGKAVNNVAVGLAPQSASTHDVVVFFENTALLRQLADIGNSAEVNYRIISVMNYQFGDDKQDLKSDTKGSLNLRALFNTFAQ